jgi:hypothetical protein
MMTPMEMYSLLNSLEASPAAIVNLIHDYRKLSSHESTNEDKIEFAIKIYKLVEPVINLVKQIPGYGQTASSAILAFEDLKKVYQDYQDGTVSANHVFSAISSSSDALAQALKMIPTPPAPPQSKAAALGLEVISKIASYGATMTNTGGDYIDPKVANEREQAIKNHIPSKVDNHDATEEYYKQAKNLMAKEGGWSLSMDVDITTAMLKQGYDQKSIMDAMKRLSPDTAGASDKEAQAYADYIIDRERKRSQITLSEDSSEKIGNPTRIDEIKNSSIAVKDLPRNPDSKSLFTAYAKETSEKNGQVWTADTNKQIVESMLKDGRTPQRIVEALKQSPEPIANAYYYVKEIGNTPEMQQMQKAKGIAR